MASGRKSAKKDAAAAPAALRYAAQSVTHGAAGGATLAAADGAGATGASGQRPQDGGQPAGGLKVTALPVAAVARILSAAENKSSQSEKAPARP